MLAWCNSRDLAVGRHRAEERRGYQMLWECYVDDTIPTEQSLKHGAALCRDAAAEAGGGNDPSLACMW